ncbi:MAG: hypothetical protein J6X02_04460 [Bacilli bacterium]|nr:hypothetical protein [Bacilli bacterium]
MFATIFEATSDPKDFSLTIMLSLAFSLSSPDSAITSFSSLTCLPVKSSFIASRNKLIANDCS